MLRLILQFVLGRFAPAGINLIAVVTYSRFLSPADYGVCSLILAAAITVNLAAFQWLKAAVLRFGGNSASDSKQAKAVLLVAFAILTSIGLTAMVVLWCAWPRNSLPVEYALCVIPLAWATALSDMSMEWARARLNAARYGFIGVSRAVLSLLTSSVLLTIGLGIWGIVIGNIIGLLTPLAIHSPRFLSGIKTDASTISTLSNWFSYGLPLAGAYFVSGLLNYSDRFFLGMLGSLSDLGTYSLASDLAQRSLILLAQSVNLAALPLAIHQLEVSGEEAARVQLKRNVTILIGVLLPSTIGLIMLSSQLFDLLLPDAYSSATFSLMIPIAISTMIYCLRVCYVDQSFALSKTTGLQWIVNASALMLSVLGCLTLVPHMGSQGAGWSRVIAFSFALYLSWHFGRKCFELPLPGYDGIKVFVSSLLMIAFLYFAPLLPNIPGLVGRIVVAGVIYSLTLLALDFLGCRKAMFRGRR